MIAKTPAPPYFAVIFTSLRTGVDEGYGEMADLMVELAAQQPGFLGVESARSGLGITVSYWASETDIRNWKQQTDHLIAQRYGRDKWYSAYCTRVCKVERAYAWEESAAV